MREQFKKLRYFEAPKDVGNAQPLGERKPSASSWLQFNLKCSKPGT